MCLVHLIVEIYLGQFYVYPQLSYSGKFCQGKILANLVICYKFTKVLSVNCLEYLKRLGAGLKFAKVFHQMQFSLQFSLQFTKVFSRQNLFCV